MLLNIYCLVMTIPDFIISLQKIKVTFFFFPSSISYGSVPVENKAFNPSFLSPILPTHMN